MSRIPVLLACAASFAVCAVSRTEAQTSTSSRSSQRPQRIRTADSTVAMDRWITRPTSITLNVRQRAQYDTLRAGFIRELSDARAQRLAGGEMAAIMKVRDITHRYQDRLRSILTPAQQTIFDANVKADVIGR
jgi:hypothetical protein